MKRTELEELVAEVRQLREEMDHTRRFLHLIEPEVEPAPPPPPPQWFLINPTQVGEDGGRPQSLTVVEHHDGSFETVPSPASNSVLIGAKHYWLGGHQNEVTEEKAEQLRAAGYAIKVVNPVEETTEKESLDAVRL